MNKKLTNYQAEPKYEEPTKEPTGAKKALLLFFLLVFILLFVIAALSALRLADNKWDRNGCYRDFPVKYYQKTGAFTYGLSDKKVDYACFANSDFDRINLGKNINCSCFYINNISIFSEVDFFIK